MLPTNINKIKQIILQIIFVYNNIYIYLHIIYKYLDMYGIIEYDELGNPMCEVCGNHYKRVVSHVRQKHDMNEREYKKAYGFDLKKGICSKESAMKSRIRVFENYDKVVEKNLIDKGKKSRFNDGHKGRTKDQVSEQTLNRLKNHFKNINRL